VSQGANKKPPDDAGVLSCWGERRSVRRDVARFEQLYQRSIDFGGHPNERSVTGSMKMNKQPDRREMLAVMLHGDDVAFNAALKSVAQCAMVSLEMLQAVFNARFELLGINAAMIEFRRGI
jgi:hypothetical protein